MELWILLRWLWFIGFICHCFGYEEKVTIISVPGRGRTELSETLLASAVGIPPWCWGSGASNAHHVPTDAFLSGRVGEPIFLLYSWSYLAPWKRWNHYHWWWMDSLSTQAVWPTHLDRRAGVIVISRNGSCPHSAQIASTDIKGGEGGVLLAMRMPVSCAYSDTTLWTKRGWGELLNSLQSGQRYKPCPPLSLLKWLVGPPIHPSSTHLPLSFFMVWLQLSSSCVRIFFDSLAGNLLALW